MKRALSPFVLAVLLAAASVPAASECLHPREKDFVLDTVWSIPAGFEPIQLEVMPDGTMLLASRLGRILRIDADGGDPREMADLVVSGEPTGNSENSTLGILGMVLSHDFADDHSLYVYYTPQAQPPVYRLSRFTYDGSWIDNERVILEIPRDPLHRDHSGGSMDFDAEGNLYLSTGDNSLATYSSGYSPMEDAANASYNDARRTAANTADLRGKILRIIPLPFPDSLPRPPGPGSTYDIPAGNLREAYADLWREDSLARKVRGEIWAMGARNPFRLAVDRNRGWVHWGDIGPDATESSESRGPIGQDEFNVATRPGNYGWPFFVGHNRPYRVFDFATGVSGPWFDPLAPENLGKRNTGVMRLPPARGPVVTLNKKGEVETSPPQDAPESGWGWSAAAVGGAFYDTALVDPERRSHAFPAYFHGKLFIAEYMHRWIRVLGLDDTAGFQSSERFIGDHELTRLLDLTFSRDGRLHVLEWGDAYQPNDGNARITRVSYIGGDFACGEQQHPTAARPRPRAPARAGGPALKRLEAGMSLPVPTGTTGMALWSLEGRTLLRRNWDPAAAPARVDLPPGLVRNGIVWVEFLKRRR